MDLQNFNNNPQFSDCPSSPVYTQTTSYILNTPKTNKSIYDSKSPLRRLKLKKSKRRECTPAYSPKFYDEQDEKNIFHQHANTDIKKRDKIFFKDQGENKENEYRINQRLSFDDVNVKNLFPQNNTLKNFSEQTHRKKFITLIEESLNDVNDNYYGILCSQITPDTIFKTIFTNGSEEEKAKKQYQNLFLNEEEDIQGGINAYSAVQKILINLKNKNFDQLNSQIVFFSDDFSCNQLNLSDFSENFLDLTFDIQMSSYSSEATLNMNTTSLIFVPGKIQFASHDNSQNARFVFEYNSREDPSSGQVRLSVIEIQFFS